MITHPDQVVTGCDFSFLVTKGGGHWGGLNTATPQKILPNTASPQEKSVDHRHRNIYFQSDDFSVSTR